MVEPIKSVGLNYGENNESLKIYLCIILFGHAENVMDYIVVTKFGQLHYRSH